MVTPLHIKPSWYLAPYYAILRAIPSKGLGALAMLASLLMFVLLPFLDRAPVRSMRYKGPLSRIALGAFVVAFLGLLIVGGMEVSALSISLARIFTVLYFGYFSLNLSKNSLFKTSYVSGLNLGACKFGVLNVSILCK